MASSTYLRLLSLCVCLLIVSSAPPTMLGTFSDELIHHINCLNSTWKAGHNFREDLPLDYFRRLMGVQRDSKPSPLPKISWKHIDIDIPEEFDAREQWPHCPTIKEIRDQGSCASSWAFGVVETMSDRMCIHSGGRIHFRFSAEDLMTCCDYCGNGCNGGKANLAWIYWLTTGVVSGGPYGSHQGCQPYLIEPCDHHINGSRKPCSIPQSTPKCVHKCENGYKISYKEDLRQGKLAYIVVGYAEDIQKEIMMNGPAGTVMAIYTDFLYYRSGVYQHLQGELLGHHSVKLLGWGVENGTPYWIAANSWNNNWGDKGYFRIIRGRNECDIENEIYAGLLEL
ncbi:cathepsin B-like isoform X4 [Periplaneta americana]|uniref:cathepsin B-like isoform X4 n=1 Tax=Periplaneta americana TaxID=6978 RepID=UPI0037E7353C